MDSLMTHFPDIDRNTLRVIDQHQLRTRAINRAERGAAWLDRHGPLDWRLQMISIHHGRVRSHVRLAYNTQNPLALAFRQDPSVIGNDGRPKYAEAIRKFGELNAGNTESAADLGFEEQRENFGTAVIGTDVDGRLLDYAWEVILHTLDWHEVISPPTEIAA